MKKKIPVFTLCAMLFALCLPADAQQPGKIFRIGFLDDSTASNIAVRLDTFRQELSKLGWIEGKNVAIEFRFAEGKLERLPELAADLVRLKVDLIMASGAPGVLAAKNATTTIPIVMTNAADPVGAGLIASLARPGANVTGLASLAPELNTKRLEILKDALPGLSRVGLLWLSGGGRGQELQMKELRPAATALKIKLEEIETHPDDRELDSAFQTAKQKQIKAIMTTNTRPFLTERKRIVELARKYRLPAIYGQKEFVDEGGLMSYGAPYDDLHRRAAVYVDKILKGAKPADLPVQQATKVPRIGFLDGSTASSSAVLLEAFRQEMRKLGWIEGKNINIEYRFAEQKSERTPELAADLVRLKVDLIVVIGRPQALAAKKATTTIPIVMANVGDPVGAGLVASLARPGGNVTGNSALSPELNTKRLEILKDTIPKLLRVGLLRSQSGNVLEDPQLKELRPAAVALKLKLEEIDVQPDAKGLESAFNRAKQKQVNAIITTPGRRFFAERKRIVELAGKHWLPAIYPQKEFVEAGGLMCYGADNTDIYRRAAVYVDKILKGAKPADLPVQQATKFEFVINLKAAQQIGLTIPGRVLERANQVIK